MCACAALAPPAAIWGCARFIRKKLPSFNVNQTRQFYKCFGCGAGGDVLKFVMEVDGLTFPETLKLLSERHGIPMPQRPEYSDSDSQLRGALHDMHAIAAKLYRAALSGPAWRRSAGVSRPARRERRIDRNLRAGFFRSARPGFDAEADGGAFSPEQMEASGLVRRRNEGIGLLRCLSRTPDVSDS